MPAPFLPITPGEARRLTEAVRREAEARGSGRIAENVAVALVRVMRSEGPPAGSTRRIRRASASRGRRAGVLGGIGGFTTRAVGQTAGVLEGARAVVAISDAMAPGRPEEEVAADLLVLLGAASTREAARAAIDGTGPSIAGHTRERIAGAAPEEWTVTATLRFFWQTYRSVSAVRDTVKPTRLIPGVGAVFGYFGGGREMAALCRRTERLVATGSA